jgi:TorA maturation chaperone TorD
MEPEMKYSDTPEWFASYADIRTDSYVLLGSLLDHEPSEDLLNVLRSLSWDQDLPAPIDSALRALRQASFDYSLPNLEEEFDKLFVGLGCGEIVPYASWYREKRIQSSSLASLRSDLLRLGIVKRAESHESEDHAAVLCQIMALLTQKPDEFSQASQTTFFQQHISSWMTTFLKDLQSLDGAQFYRIVGLFGSEFLAYEGKYLEHDVNR